MTRARSYHVAACTVLLGTCSSLTWAQPAPSTAPPPSAAPDAVAPAVLVPPKLHKDVQPEYPAAALERGLSASVLLEIDIGVTGVVQRASVTEASLAPGLGFEEAALAAAKQLEFEPALERGKPIPVTITFRFRFVPEAPRKEALPTEQPAAAAAPQTTTKPPTSAAPKALASGDLRGRLVERGTRLPLAGVKVTVFRGEGDSAEGFETETDADGLFRLSKLGVGDWRVLADPDGYYPLRTTESVTNGLRTEVSYAIERSSYNPYDVIVDTKRVQREVNQVTIDARQAERVPGTFGDVLAVVKNFPGVAQTTLGPFSTGFVIRGSAPEDSRIYVNNIDVPLLYHFGNLRSVLPVGMIENVNFYPGNFSVQYGRATGGVVDVTLKELNRQRFGGYVDVNLFDSSLFLEAPLGDDLSVAIAGRRSYIDVLLNAALSDTGGSLVAPRYYDAQLLATYRPSAAHSLKAFFFLSDDRFEVIFDNPASLDAESVVTDFGLSTNFYRGVAEYRYVPGPRFENEFKVSMGRDRNIIRFGDLANNDERLYQGQVRNTLRYVVRDSLAVRGGLDYLYQQRDARAKLPELPEEGEGDGPPSFADTTSSSSEDTFHSIAGFAELEWRPWSSMLVIPGFRLDYFGRTGKVAASPRLAVRQTVAKNWVLKGGIGLFQQEPTFDETLETRGNPDLELEKAMHYSAGFEYTPRPYLNFGVTGFYKSLHDLVSRTDALTTRDGQTVPLNYTNGAIGRVMGLEVSAKHELTNNLFAWLAYTLSKSERRDPGKTEYRLFDHDQTHILTFTGSYRLPKNWEIGARYRYVTGQLYTPISSSVFDSDADSYLPISARVNSARFDAFHQLDIRIDKRWVYESWMLNAYLDIQNVYSQRNVSSIEHNYDYSEEVPETGLPIVPVLGLRGEF